MPYEQEACIRYAPLSGGAGFPVFLVQAMHTSPCQDKHSHNVYEAQPWHSADNDDGKHGKVYHVQVLDTLKQRPYGNGETQNPQPAAGILHKGGQAHDIPVSSAGTYYDR